MGIAHLKDRSLLRVLGEDARTFLHSLVTQDMNLLRADTLLYSLLLTPQGRYAADFFLKDEGDAILVDVHTQHCERLKALFTRYKLRQRVTVEVVDDLQVWALWGESVLKKAQAAHVTTVEPLQDPRLKALGVRFLLGPAHNWVQEECFEGYHAHQMRLGVADSSYLLPEKSIPLEYGFHLLNGIALDKGCYLGQELITRTLRRGQIRRRVLPARILEGAVQPEERVYFEQEEVGKVIGVHKSYALVRVLFDKVCCRGNDSAVTCQMSGGGLLSLSRPDWLDIAP